MPRGTRIGTREEILATALDLFRDRGYDATSLREIAERLDITKAALYYHFPAKEQIVIDLSRQFLNDLADLVAKARSGSDVVLATRRAVLLSDYLDLLVTHHKVIDLLSRNPSTQNHPDVGRRARTLVDAMTAELAGRDASVEDKLRMGCAIGALHAVTLTPVGDAQKAKSTILGAALAALNSSAAPGMPQIGAKRRQGRSSTA